VRHRVNAVLPPRRIDGVIGPVHRNDTMLRATGRERYHRTAVETIDLFAARAEAAGVDPAEAKWFEIGCGYGRLVRVLGERVGADRVWACDVDPDASRFCERAFGVHRVLSNRSFHFEPPVAADVVVALSVATHLPAAGFERFLASAVASVADGGVLLFTTHGRAALDQLGAYDAGAYLPMEGELRAAFEGQDGVAYVPYAVEPDAGYGMTWLRPDAVLALVARAAGAVATDVAVEEALIEGHQDLWVCRVTR
jgi:SAM-dependent methyltransferase